MEKEGGRYIPGGAENGGGATSGSTLPKRRKRRQFDRAFKLEAVRRVRERGGTGLQVARDFAIHRNLIYRWVKEFREDPRASFPGKGRMMPLKEENRLLRRMLAETEMERDILKKAAGMFSRQS